MDIELSMSWPGFSGKREKKNTTNEILFIYLERMEGKIIFVDTKN